MAEKREDKKNIFQGENVIVHKTMPQGGDVPSIGHVHEERDVPIDSLLKSVVYLVVGIGLVTLACWGLFQFFANQAEQVDARAGLSPLMEQRTPPGPRLQSNPRKDMNAFRAWEDSVLAAAGGVASDGTRRITVDEAMTLIAERGLPRFPETAMPSDSAATTGARTDTTTGAATPADTTRR